jgi:FHA domain
MSQSCARTPPSWSRPARNRGTQVLSPRRSVVSFWEIWRRVFADLDACYRSYPRDGVLVVAVFRDRLEGHLHVPLQDQPAFALVGRHTSCDLQLPSDGSVALRHLLLVLRRSGSELRVRLCDLGTGAGMATEDGLTCEALAADGAAFVSVGEYQLYCLPTGDLAPLPWGSRDEEAWAAIPERIYVDRRAARRGPPVPVSLLPSRPRRRSITTQIIDPPTALRQPLPPPGDRGAPLGQIEIATLQGCERYQAHDIDFDRGLLVGRYERCLLAAGDPRLSRVHLALLRDGPDLFAVDTASSNGTTQAGVRIRQVHLQGPTELRLAHDVRLRWQPEGAPRFSESAPLHDRAPTTAPIADALLASLSLRR